MGEEKKVVVEKKVVKKEEVITTAEYKLNIHCPECARAIEQHFYQHEGVQKVEVKEKEGKVIVKGVKFDMVKIRESVEKKCRRKVELLTPIPKKEEKIVVIKEEKKKEEIFIYEVKVYMHCGQCENIIKEEILKHKSVYSVKTNRDKHMCTVVGTIEEKTLIEHIKERTSKKGQIISKKVEIREEEKKIEVKKDGGEIKINIVEKKETEEIKTKEVVAPYFIPCSHPRFLDYSHPNFYNHNSFNDYGYSHCSHGHNSYGHNSYGNNSYGYCRPHYGEMQEFKDLKYPPFLHCTHSPELLNDENPYACSIM